MTRVVMTPRWETWLDGVTEKRLLDPVVEAIASDANRLAPVGKTHRLAGSYEASGRGLTRRVGSSLEYAACVELGTHPRLIHVKSREVLADESTGEVFGETVQHPGTRPQPHLRPAVYRRRSI